MPSQYLGVYTNNYAPTKDMYPYRAALKRYVNSKPEYNNLGYFKREETAAYVFNIFSIGTFGKGATINDIELTDEIEEELEEYRDTMPGFEGMVNKAIDILAEHGQEITIHVPDMALYSRKAASK